MAKSRKGGAISQRNDATSINNRRGMARRAKRNASKKERQSVKKEVKMLEIPMDDEISWAEESCCSTCGAPWGCICHEICDTCGGRMAPHIVGEDEQYPNMSGYWCDRCGPFADLEKFNG